MAYYRTHHLFTSDFAKFLIAPRDQDGVVRLYHVHTQTGEPLGEFPSAHAAFATIYAQQTGYQPWDSVDSARAVKEAMEDSQWRHPRIAALTDPRDHTVQQDEPDQIPPPVP